MSDFEEMFNEIENLYKLKEERERAENRELLDWKKEQFDQCYKSLQHLEKSGVPIEVGIYDHQYKLKGLIAERLEIPHNVSLNEEDKVIAKNSSKKELFEYSLIPSKWEVVRNPTHGFALYNEIQDKLSEEKISNTKRYEDYYERHKQRFEILYQKIPEINKERGHITTWAYGHNTRVAGLIAEHLGIPHDTALSPEERNFAKISTKRELFEYSLIPSKSDLNVALQMERDYFSQ